MTDAFKHCPSCRYSWKTRDDFLTDSEVRVVGYQAFGDDWPGLFLFNHITGDDGCGTTLAIEAARFVDLHRGPIFRSRPHGAPCPSYCVHGAGGLRPCPPSCECAYVRTVLRLARRWPKAQSTNRSQSGQYLAKVR